MVDEFKVYAKGSPDEQLDEQQAHRFLEAKGEAHTVVEMREKVFLRYAWPEPDIALPGLIQLRTIDLDFNKRISIIEWLLFKFKKTLKVFSTRR